MKKERKIINTTIRLNLMNEQDRQAWNYLRGMDRKKYKSYTKAVVLALNDYFSRQEQIEADEAKIALGVLGGFAVLVGALALAVSGS